MSYWNYLMRQFVDAGFGLMFTLVLIVLIVPMSADVRNVFVGTAMITHLVVAPTFAYLQWRQT